jgi:cyclohexa-1,5-dienecarbonyl-CoA hydratase
MAMPKAVHVEELEGGRVARVVLGAGRGNILDTAALHELREALEGLRRHRSLCAAILDHEGPHFSFGASVAEHEQPHVAAMLAAFRGLAREVLELPLPLVAAVRGACLGGGLELVSLCDRVFAERGARFAQPEISLGVFAPLGTLLLPRIVGPRAAADILLTGRSLGASEALETGLVDWVGDDPSAAALEWTREHLCTKSAAALRQATRALRGAQSAGWIAGLRALEAQYLEELVPTDDAREGIRAFLEKRPPRWSDS